MAIKLVRKKRKNADGSYDVVHYETQAKIVWFEDGESFQEKYDKGELRGPQGEQGVPGSPGQPGQDGQPGSPGQPGQDGADGVSPTVSVQAISGGHRVTVTDRNGSRNFDVLDGQPGQAGAPGKDGSDGSPGAAGYTPQKGTDYWTEADKAEMVEDVLAALPRAEGVKY